MAALTFLKTKQWQYFVFCCGTKIRHSCMMLHKNEQNSQEMLKLKCLETSNQIHLLVKVGRNRKSQIISMIAVS
jgi:hypothetical protein